VEIAVNFGSGGFVAGGFVCVDEDEVAIGDGEWS
jgi:hypothetical protein